MNNPYNNSVVGYITHSTMGRRMTKLVTVEDIEGIGGVGMINAATTAGILSYKYLETLKLLSIPPRFETESDDVPLMSLALVSESSLKKDWLKPEEDDAWSDL